MKYLKYIMNFLFGLLYLLTLVVLFSVLQRGFKSPYAEDFYISRQMHIYIFASALLINILIFVFFYNRKRKVGNFKDV
ncbi:MAG: hypothetical protein BM556_11415 [Bacteriovorax sp. MedPE-SWde]|mgnify:FL=1|nr:MAG: hypothetical protein BM556_11415 [Bacteriovorax sp. MedPE-SWde]